MSKSVTEKGTVLVTVYVIEINVYTNVGWVFQESR